MSPRLISAHIPIAAVMALQAACNPFASPSVGPVQTEGPFKQIPMPVGGFRSCFYRKNNPHKLFLSQKEEYGPGLMLDLDTGEQEWFVDRDPDPGGHMIIPGESKEAFLKRQDKDRSMPGESREAFLQRWEANRPKPVAPDELFACAKDADIKNSSTRREGYYIDLQGEYTKTFGVVTKGDPFPTGLRETEENLFTGDLILTVHDKVLLRQHFKNTSSKRLRIRTDQAINEGLIFYYDERPDGTGTLYIFQVPRRGPSAEIPEEGQVIIGKPHAQTPPTSVPK